MENYKADGGVEATGTAVKAEIQRWASDPMVRVAPIAAVAESIELFAP